MELDVKPPATAEAGSLVTWANGRRVPHSLVGAAVRFRVPGTAGKRTDWAVTWERNRIRLPRRCVDRRKFTFKLHHARRSRVVDVVAYVNGKRKLHKHGRRIERLTLKRLPKRKFTVKIVATQSRGSKLISTRTYRGCTKSRPHTHRRRHPR